MGTTGLGFRGDLSRVSPSKEIKIFKVFRCLELFGSLCRPEITKAVKLPRTTVWECLYILKRRRQVDQRKIQQPAGRPKEEWFIVG